MPSELVTAENWKVLVFAAYHELPEDVRESIGYRIAESDRGLNDTHGQLTFYATIDDPKPPTPEMPLKERLQLKREHYRHVFASFSPHPYYRSDEERQWYIDSGDFNPDTSTGTPTVHVTGRKRLHQFLCGKSTASSLKTSVSELLRLIASEESD